MDRPQSIALALYLRMQNPTCLSTDQVLPLSLQKACESPRQVPCLLCFVVVLIAGDAALLVKVVCNYQSSNKRLA